MLPLKYTLTYCCLLFGIIIVSVLNILENKDSTYSFIFCSYYLFTLYTIWIASDKQIQPYLLFYLTFGLFIGGRFWANLMGYEGNVWEPTFFFSYSVSHEHKVELLRQVIGFMCCSLIGYALSKRNMNRNSLKIDIHLSSKTINQINILLKRLYVFFLVYIVYAYTGKLIAALDSGYLSLYIDKQSGEHATGANLLDALFTVAVGLAMGYGDSKNRRNYLILFIIVSLFMIFIGSRSAFGVTLLLLLWIYSQYHKVNLKKLLLISMGSMLLLLFVASFSIRNTGVDFQMKDIWNIILIFIYDQGISLMVFDASKLIDPYPVLSYFTRFFPGVAGIAGLFTGETYNPQDLSGAAYMCYELNPKLYLGGQGLGWSILSDIYLFSFRVFPIFLLLSTGWGYLIGKLEYTAVYSRFFKSYLYIIISGLLMVPRGSIAGIFPYIFYLLVCLYSILFFLQIIRIKK